MFSNTHPEIGTGKWLSCFHLPFVCKIYFGRLWTSLEVFRHLWESSDMFVSSSKTWHSQDINVAPITQKKLAGE